MGKQADRNSLEAMQARGDRITAHCSNTLGATPCTHYGEIPLEQLIERYGPGFVFAYGRTLVARHLVCSRCGAKDPTFILNPGQTGPSWSG